MSRGAGTAGQKLEQAAYEVARVERQCNAVEPSNRLVARSLEKRWETALAEYDQLLAEREAIHELAKDIPALCAGTLTTRLAQGWRSR